MKNIVSVKTLKEHWEKTGREDSEMQLKAWFHEVKKSNWKSPNEVKQIYRNASIVGDNRMVFNICGNKYRLIVKINELSRSWDGLMASSCGRFTNFATRSQSTFLVG